MNLNFLRIHFLVKVFLIIIILMLQFLNLSNKLLINIFNFFILNLILSPYILLFIINLNNNYKLENNIEFNFISEV